MNKELVKFIELCLADGEISEKERKVIFRKAEEFGVPKDECEIILEGLVLQQMEISNKSYTKKEFVKIGALSSAYEEELEKQAEKEKESKKPGVFGFNSLDSKLLFWGIVGIVGSLFFMAGEKITEAPTEPGALWQVLLGIVFIGWVLAKWIDE